jgi:hypothetical protein
MRVVISGGSGLIGSALTASLAADGHEVFVLSRSPDSVTGLPTGASAVGWDGKSTAGWGELVAGAAVVNLAGAGIADGRWTPERKQAIRASRIDSTRAVTEAIREAGEPARVLVQGSAVGYYGPGGDRMLSEEAQPGSDFLAGVCVEWEGSSVGVEAAGVRRAVIRTGVVLSSEGGALPRMLLPFRLFAGGPVGSGNQWLPWIHLVDEVRAIRFLIDHPDASGPFNLAAPEPVTNRQFAQAIGKVMHRPSFLPAPAFALRLMMGELADLVLEGQRAVPQRLQELGFTFRFPTAQDALTDLLD